MDLEIKESQETREIDEKRFKSLLGLALALPLLAALVLAGVFLWQISRLSQASSAVERVDRNLIRIGHLENLALKMETGVRGFVVTGDDAFLRPYREALPQIKPQLDTIRLWVVDGNAAGLVRFNDLSSRIDDWIRFSGVLINSRRHEKASTGAIDSEVGLGNQKMIAIRNTIDGLLASQNHARDELAGHFHRTVKMLILSVVLATFLYGLVLALISRNQLIFLSESYRGVLSKERAHETKLRQSRDELNVILHGITEGISVLNRAGDFVYGNDAAARLCGFETLKDFLSTPADAITNSFEIYDEKGEIIRLGELPGRQVLAGKTPPPETLIRFRDKKTNKDRWSLVSATPVFDAHGNVTQAINIFRDITESKIAADSLKASENRLRALADAMPQIVWTTDASGSMTFQNARMTEYFGAPDAGSVELYEYVHPDDRRKTSEHWQKAVADGTIFEIEHRFRRNDGAYRWFLTRGIPVKDATGKIVEWIGTSTDIEDQKVDADFNRFLAESSQILFSSLNFEATLAEVAKLAVPGMADWCTIDVVENGVPRTVAVAHKDPEKLKWAKEFSARYPPDRDSKTGVPQVIRSGVSEFHTEIPDQLLVRAARDPEHLRLIREIGLRSAMVVPLVARGHILGAVSFFSAESGRRYSRRDLGMAEELARRAGIAVDNALLYAQAQQAVQARDQFLSIASHELKTPITSLSLQLQMTKRAVNPGENKLPTPSQLARVLDVSTRQVQRLTGLVEDLLDVSRIRAGKLSVHRQKVELCELIKNEIDRLKDEFEKAGIAVTFRCPGPVYGEWDALRLEQVMVNLLSNATKYAPGGPLAVTVTADDQTARVAVRDSGPGIPEDRQRKVFDRFERATSGKGITGLGLGLFIVKEIVEAHGGKVDLESAMGGGSTFTVSLPLKEPASADVQVPAPGEPQVVLRPS